MTVEQLQSETTVPSEETRNGDVVEAGATPVKSEWRAASAEDVAMDLKTCLSSMLSAVVPEGPVALVDYPDHSNVGDCAIWLGEMAWLKVRNKWPAYVASMRDFSSHALKAAAPEGPILIHGGGNFGTIWMKHEAFRLHLLDQFKGRPIVQMPQSICYGDRRHVDEMARAIDRHGAFRLLVRDRKSYDFANAHFDCDVLLCPDAAFYLGPLSRGRATTDIVALLRDDCEKVESFGRLPEGTYVTDWLKEEPYDRGLVRTQLKIASLFLADEQLRLARYQRLAHWRLKRGLSILSRGRVVISDRLHAHILSLLLGIPHVALDNSYGKVSGFIRQWTDRYRWLAQARDLAEAHAKASHLLAEGSINGTGPLRDRDSQQR